MMKYNMYNGFSIYNTFEKKNTQVFDFYALS